MSAKKTIEHAESGKARPDSGAEEGQNFQNKFERRIKKMAEWLASRDIAAVMFEDSEERREPSVRYFTGHPADAVLVIASSGKSVLCPWDVHLAAKASYADIIVPFTKYGRSAVKSAAGILKTLKIPENSRIEIPAATPYPVFLHYVDELSQYNVICRENGAHHAADSFREIKDDYEISVIREAAAVTDKIIEMIEHAVRNKLIQTELDAMMLIEREARAAGCEGTSFETLAAGPERSFGIHAFPSCTAGAFPADGLSILDFGVKYRGYCSDVTLTIAAGTLSEEQEKQIELVEKAYAAALRLYAKDVPVRTAAAKADEIFAKAKMSMPHSLGHGTGLAIHEAPFVRSKVDAGVLFQPGMVVTLEPGLYNPLTGGCRLENDILITENGNEALTHSRIIRI
ncbi:MAG: Xaa-Pro peptidase family protein [Bacteroides sp.]|nr:Xaa-Pro peptidase family protein [Prevotella sp.]MCM1408546.1 Xaa-Pro peptidase family protein [Treponema brennaborense]MCM1470740.1 Xaa-Pro peptidase family protein [Bacteroides sp.]